MVLLKEVIAARKRLSMHNLVYAHMPPPCRFALTKLIWFYVGVWSLALISKYTGLWILLPACLQFITLCPWYGWFLFALIPGGIWAYFLRFETKKTILTTYMRKLLDGEKSDKECKPREAVKLPGEENSDKKCKPREAAWKIWKEKGLEKLQTDEMNKFLSSKGLDQPATVLHLIEMINWHSAAKPTYRMRVHPIFTSILTGLVTALVVWIINREEQWEEVWPFMLNLIGLLFFIALFVGAVQWQISMLIHEWLTSPRHNLVTALYNCYLLYIGKEQYN